MNRLVGIGEVEAAAAAGGSRIQIAEGMIVTPAARDRARELGVALANGAGPGSTDAPEAELGATRPAIADEPPREMLLEMYRHMVTDRLLAETETDLWFGGEPERLGARVGQEAIPAGAGFALRRVGAGHQPPDLVVGIYVRRIMGLSLKEALMEGAGKATGVCGGRSGGMQLMAPEIGLMGGGGIIGVPVPLGAGVALGAKMRGGDQATIAFFGDGAVNQGLFHEGMNFAAIHSLPVVMFCINNGYQGQTAAWKVTSIDRLSDRAASYGIRAEFIDGNDVLAVYDATRRALDDVRNGRGPVMLEAETYRSGGLSVLATGYRTQDELDAWRNKDPLARFERYLMGRHLIDEQSKAAIVAELQRELDDAMEAARAAPFPTVDTLATNVYAEVRNA